MVPITSKETDHRIRLNDEELRILTDALKATITDDHTPEDRKKVRLRLRLATLGGYRR